MSYSIFSGPLGLTHPVTWFIELSIALLLLFQLMSNGVFLGGFLWSIMFGSYVYVNEEQRRLMAIPAQDSSFYTPQKYLRSTKYSTPVTFSGAGDSNQFISRSPSPNLSYSPNMYTSINHGSPYGSFVSTSSGRNSFNASFNNSLDRSLNLSQSFSRSENDRNSLRSRRSSSLPVSSGSSKYKHITDMDTLHQFIQEEEEREINKSQASPDSLPLPGTSFWSYGASPMDMAHSILRRFAYQLAPRSAVSPLAPRQPGDHPGTGGLYGQFWAKYNVTEDDLYRWTEKLRKWLSFTIISKLHQEIEEINCKLNKVNAEDKIGKVGLSTLTALSKQRLEISNFASLMPFLEFTANQEYLYNRIKDLSTGSLSEYLWNKGGDYDKPWSQHLPTDAALVMHMVCCYLDARLPVHTHHTHTQPFTHHHFIKTPDKPKCLRTHSERESEKRWRLGGLGTASEDHNSSLDAEKEANIILYQSQINPPHFQVVIGNEVHNLCKGRNNMFQALLLFLYHIKMEEHGMLGRINLGMSGLNILWIFD